MNKISKMVLVGMILSTSVQAQGKFIPEGLTWNTTQAQFGPVLNRMGFTFEKRQQSGDLQYTGFYINGNQRVQTSVVAIVDSNRKLVGLTYVMNTLNRPKTLQDIETASDLAAKIWTDIATKFTTKYGNATSLYNEVGAAYWFGGAQYDSLVAAGVDPMEVKVQEDVTHWSLSASGVVVELGGTDDYKTLVVVKYDSGNLNREYKRRKRVANRIF
jgi:hypothetical protein